MKQKIKVSAILVLVFWFVGCGTEKSAQNSGGFFTSGNREADQRAEQRVDKTQQIKGKGQDNGNGAIPQTLYDRLGGEHGVQVIMDDFVPRVIADPRVNWERKGITHGVLHAESAQWNPTPAQLEALKLHLREFVAVATGGPSHYEGQGMKEAHHGLKISNVEFDAAVGDLKATLDKLGTATADQKELLAIIESTRAQIVEIR